MESSVFGEITIKTQTTTNNLRLPGQYVDSEIGLNQNYFRDYALNLGRYMETDPIGLRGGINTYTYVTSNPLSLTDPRGQDLFGNRPSKKPFSGCYGRKCGMPQRRPLSCYERCLARAPFVCAPTACIAGAGYAKCLLLQTVVTCPLFWCNEAY